MILSKSTFAIPCHMTDLNCYRREASSLFIEIYGSVLLGQGILNMGYVCAIYGSMGHVCAIYGSMGHVCTIFGSVTASSLLRNTPTLFLPSYFSPIFLRRLIILPGGMEIVIDSIWRRCITEQGLYFTISERNHDV